jgi:hypothetical protein
MHFPSHILVTDSLSTVSGDLLHSPPKDIPYEGLGVWPGSSADTYTIVRRSTSQVINNVSINNFQRFAPGPEQKEEWVKMWGNTNVDGSRAPKARKIELGPKGGSNTLNPLMPPDRFGIFKCPHPPKNSSDLHRSQEWSWEGWKPETQKKIWRITCNVTSSLHER